MPRTKPTAVRTLGGERLEGRRAVLECLRAGRRRVRRVIVAAGTDPVEVLDAAARAGVPVEVVDRSRFERLARTRVHQGVLAECDPFVDAGLAGLAEASLLVVVDHLEDPHNLGAIARSAAALGAHGLLLSRYRQAPVTAAVAKVAAGGLEWLSLAEVSSIPAALRRLGELRFWRVGLDAEAAGSVFDLSVATERLALVVGSEGRGLTRLVRRELDVSVSIPMVGTVASLNASVSVGIALAAIAHARGSVRTR
jgi:23S rRNA (guanosine2251-2'-O)-methyltransferase